MSRADCALGHSRVSAFIARSEHQPETSNFLGLRENGIDGSVCHPLIGGFEIPGFDALQVLLEALGEAKRLRDASCHVQRGGVPSPI